MHHTDTSVVWLQRMADQGWKSIKTRLAMVKQAFWKMSELITGNVNLTAWKRLLNCYVFFVLKHGIESWTLDKSMPKSIMAFEYWCYRQMLKISWRDKVKITEVLSRMVVTEPQLSLIHI